MRGNECGKVGNEGIVDTVFIVACDRRACFGFVLIETCKSAFHSLAIIEVIRRCFMLGLESFCPTGVVMFNGVLDGVLQLPNLDWVRAPGNSQNWCVPEISGKLCRVNGRRHEYDFQIKPA